MSSRSVVSATLLAIGCQLALAHTHGGLSHEDASTLHQRNVEPPLPSALGRGITGCFLQDARHCPGLAGVPPAPPTAFVPAAYRRVPLGHITPSGWLARQLLLQADGVSGWYQALFYPPVNQSTWVGGTVKYEGLDYMVTYWLNGNVPLSLLLRNAALRPKVDLPSITDAYVAFIVGAQDPSTGMLGPDACGAPSSKLSAAPSTAFHGFR